MTAKDVYLRLADACEQAAAATLIPDTKSGLLASAAVWRRLADTYRVAEKSGLNARQDKVAVLEDSEARSVSRPSMPILSSSKN